MKIIKQNDLLIFELSVLGRDYIVVSKPQGQITPINNISFSNESVRKQKLILKTIKSDIENQGYYFVNVTPYHSECLACGSKLSYNEVVVNNDKCCGSLRLLPSYAEIKEKILGEVVIFDKYNHEAKVVAMKPEPMELWLSVVKVCTKTFEIKEIIEPVLHLNENPSINSMVIDSVEYTIDSYVKNDNGLYYYFGDSKEDCTEFFLQSLLNVEVSLKIKRKEIIESMDNTIEFVQKKRVGFGNVE